MRAEIYSYIRGTFPYIILVGIIVFSVLNLCFPNGRRRAVYRIAMGCAFVIYVGVVIFVTLGMRQFGSVHDLKLHPFWSYETVMRTKDPEMLIENVANIALFFPLGIFIRDRWEKRSRWQYSILVAFCCSLTIECLQLIFGLGTFEIDDMIHNTLGALLGYLSARKIQQLAG